VESHRSDLALLEWAERAAPRIALDGPEDPAELEAVSEVFELVERTSPGNPAILRTLGYLHLRERRWDDARAAFEAAAAAGGDEPAARRHLDRARLELTRGAYDEAIHHAELGLACEELWYSTRDDLRDTLERALGAAGRANDALAVLDQRAADCGFSFELHHRLARERIARGDVAGAGAVLERAAAMPGILGTSSTSEQRLSASFEPIIAELDGGRRPAEARELETLLQRIRDAN
jgi:tetratricopeptide (TPR) repeat protein